MAVTLSADEIDLADKLHLTGLSRPAAVLAVVMANPRPRAARGRNGGDRQAVPEP